MLYLLHGIGGDHKEWLYGAPLPRLIMICNGEQDDIVHKISAYYEETLTKNGIAHLYYTMPRGHAFTV